VYEASASIPGFTAAAEAVRIVENAPVLHVCHRQQGDKTKAALAEAGIPVLANPSHIVPAMIGDAAICKMASDRLLERHGVYIQPINYPTVAQGHRAPAHHADAVSRR